MLVSIAILFFGTFQSRAQSLFSDIKAHEVGDIVTVLIVESANASRESKVSNSAATDMGADGSVSGTLTNYLPLFGMSGAVSNSHSGVEGTEQKDKMVGKITASIIERTEAGLCLIRGERIVEVNGEQNLMQIEGRIRTRDIGANNTVYSYNVADARVIYKKTGFKNRVMKPGTGQKAIVWLLSLGLLAVSVTGVLMK